MTEASVTEDWGFLRACDLARTADESFRLAWIEEVEAAWHVVDLDHGAYGFIVVMADDKRQYWRYTSEDTGAGRPEDLVVTELAAGQTPQPDLEAQWYKPDVLNKRLAVLRRVT
jgi:hypothetical protein